MNFKAGYIVDGVSNQLIENFPKQSIFTETSNNKEILKLRGLLEFASNFSVQTNSSFEIDYDNIPKLLAVQNNILTRGLPTRAPLLLEKLFNEIGLSQIEETKRFEYKFKVSEYLENKISYDAIYRKLHLIYPKLNINRNTYLGDLDSNLEWEFLENSHPIFQQILQSQRRFETIAHDPLVNRTVDFSFTLPYYFNEAVRTPYRAEQRDNVFFTKVLEVDGHHHFITEGIYYDSLRDKLIEESNGEVVRFPYYKIKNNLGADDSIDKEIEKIFIDNYNSNIQDELPVLTYVLLPFNVARLQKFFIELFIRNKELLAKDSVDICVVERDLPSAAIALALFKEFIANQNNLVFNEEKLILPSLNLTIYQDKKWVYDERLNLNVKTFSLEDFDKTKFDVVIDNSILIREGIYNFEDTMKESFYTLRSIHYIESNNDQQRQIYCSKSIKYKSLVFRNPDTTYTDVKDTLPSIEFFLQNIFRKKSFREGQLPIISRALQKLPVIGLLPTGGGKSLTYQIPVFLQPTISLVVDPIKSLMEDQVRVLRENWIDNIAYANSSQSQYIRNKAVIDFKFGTKQLIFISPERFVIEEFRNLVKNIDTTGKGQSLGYCIIDEVHCVSEWGHDFRYDYLLLGKNAQDYCKSKDGIVSLMGLTATASFDVLADIERELQIKSNEVAEAVIMIENTVRPELFFRVVNVTNSINRSEILLDEIKNFHRTFKYFNNKELLVKSQKHHFENYDPKDFAEVNENNTYKFDKDNKLIFKQKLNQLLDKLPNPYNSIVFCPVRGITRSDKTGEFLNKKGVRYNHELLKNNGVKAGYFYGSDNDTNENTAQNIINENFHNFMNGTYSTMVCTKAFGMGIDKEDIRATVHINYSSSLESLVQECGRAGRDKKVSVATILASDKEYLMFDHLKFTEFYKGLNNFDLKVIKENLVEFYNNGEKVKIKFNSPEHFSDFLSKCKFGFTKKNGEIIYLTDFKVKTIKEKIIENQAELLMEKSEDRDIHDFFYENNFKGKVYEDAQLESLFTMDVPLSEDESYALYEILEQTENDSTFEFIIPFESELENINLRGKYNTNDLTPYEREFILQAPFFSKIYDKFDISENKILETFKIYHDSDSIEEFWQKIELEKILSLDTINSLTHDEKYEIEKPFISQRNAIETGRLIYRLHSIGFLEGYTKDYVNKTYKCKFYKGDSIHYYVNKLEEFFKRYQSEKTAKESIRFLINKLNFHDDNYLFHNLLIILKYLTDFTYNEIASKRKKATDEVKSLIEKILHSDLDEYQKNLILKDEIYFYFNAKYARKGFIENGKNYSLLDDYYENSDLDKIDILFKYIDDELLKFGTEQNNYKHLIGTCKKLLRNLTETENKKDWLLHLLLSFAFYSTNSLSYRYDANRTLENGFSKLLKDKDFMEDDLSKIIEIFDFYFEKLDNNIREDNPLKVDIHFIQNKVLHEIQSKMLETYITQLS